MTQPIANLGRMAKALCLLLCFSITNTLLAQVQFFEESTITTEGLYFYYANGSKAYHYNPNISPRGDCVSVVNGYIFFGWYKGGMTKRNLMISRKKIGSGNWVTVQLPHTNTLIQPGNLWGDSHNTISVGVSAIDGTVHIFYDHHNDPLKYIVSKPNKAFAPDSEFTLSAFEPTQGYLVPGQPITITYPKITQNDAGEIILNYRKGSAVGGNEMVHVYDGSSWTSNTQVTRGGGLPHVAVEDRNYAYGVPYYNNGDVYYAFSVRWAAKQDDGVLNEGVYLAKCGPDMTSPWEDPSGVQHALPIQDYSPFLVDLPASNAGKGSSGGPGLVVSEDGSIHLSYDGRGSGNTYEYTYTREAGESSFTKHTGTRKTGLAWNNRFYTIGASTNGNITITSGEPGSVNYTTELVHSTSRNFGTTSSYIKDGKLVLIASENKQADKKDIYCYVFQLPADPGISGLSDQTMVKDTTAAIPFTITNMDPSGLSITVTSSNQIVVPNSGLTVGGSGLSGTLTVIPTAGQVGTTDITIVASNGPDMVEETFTLTVTPPKELIAAWDTWDSATAPSSTISAPGVNASATASTSSGSWSISDTGTDLGRGSSEDTTWGSFDGNGIAASSITNVGAANFTATNGKTDAELTLTLVNNGPVDLDLDEFHMDALAFRPNAARTYALNVLAGSDITVGNVFTSTSLDITELGGGLSGHDQHDDLNLDLSGLADSTLEIGGTAIIQIAFSGGTGSGGGHHLFLDNVAISGFKSYTLSQLDNWRYTHFGSIENSGNGADDYDANEDGESNLLEFATHQDPHASTRLATTLSNNGTNLTFSYPRSKAALADGMAFNVMWSDTLLPGSWSSVGVSEFVATEYTDYQNVIATIPAGIPGPRFIILKVVSP